VSALHFIPPLQPHNGQEHSAFGGNRIQGKDAELLIEQAEQLIDCAANLISLAFWRIWYAGSRYRTTHDRVDIEPVSLGDHGHRYRVTYAGNVLGD